MVRPKSSPGQGFQRPVLDAILYIARTGSQWRMLPKDFPPFTTVQGYFYDWRDNSLFEKINFELLLQVREAAGREASPSAGVIDSQSVKTTESDVLLLVLGCLLDMAPSILIVTPILLP